MFRTGFKKVAVTLAPLLFAVSFPMAGYSQAANSEDLVRAFDEADLNADGHLSIDEYVGYLVQVFAARDRDRDGFLTASELPTVSEARFSHADRDGDGMISLGEGMGSKVVDFFDADLNRDGTMDLEELLLIEKRLAGQ